MVGLKNHHQNYINIYLKNNTMKAIFNFFKKRKEEKERLEKLYNSVLKPDLKKNIKLSFSAIAKEMEIQLNMLIDLQKKIDEMENKTKN